MLGVLWVACRGRHALVVENLLLRQQVAVALRSRRRPRLTRRDRRFWGLARWLTGEWRRPLGLVSPDTIVRWHRHGWRRFWRWRSRTRLGRPHLPAEVRELIATMSRENVLWGTERLRGEPRTLGIAVSHRSIRRYRLRGPQRPPSQTWRTFLANHAHPIWAADLFTVQTLTVRTLYGLFFIGHGRRELLHCRVTAHPTAAWVWRQVLNATPWGRAPRYLLRDRDRVYGYAFSHRVKGMGIREVLTAPHSPWQNPICGAAHRLDPA